MTVCNHGPSPPWWITTESQPANHRTEEFLLYTFFFFVLSSLVDIHTQTGRWNFPSLFGKQSLLLYITVFYSSRVFTKNVKPISVYRIEFFLIGWQLAPTDYQVECLALHRSFFLIRYFPFFCNVRKTKRDELTGCLRSQSGSWRNPEAAPIFLCSRNVYVVSPPCRQHRLPKNKTKNSINTGFSNSIFLVVSILLYIYSIR